MRVTILASGSGGNATLVQAGGTRVLVDAGIGPDAIRTRMRQVFGQELGIDAIVSTHAHGDHCGKIAECARSFGARVYVSEATHRRIGTPIQVRTIVYGYHTPFDIGAIRVSPTPIPHDAPQVAIVVEHAGARAAIVTDLGEVPRRLVRHLRGCQLVLMESNHDPEMLERGPYPEFLKRRVASRVGHLSNAQCAEVLAELGDETTEIVLVHLSRTNNSPELALETSRAALRGRAVNLRIAPHDEPLDLEVRSAQRQLTLPLWGGEELAS